MSHRFILYKALELMSVQQFIHFISENLETTNEFNKNTHQKKKRTHGRLEQSSQTNHNAYVNISHGGVITVLPNNELMILLRAHSSGQGGETLSLHTSESE